MTVMSATISCMCKHLPKRASSSGKIYGIPSCHVVQPQMLPKARLGICDQTLALHLFAPL
jgi:hypothetical protein